MNKQFKVNFNIKVLSIKYINLTIGVISPNDVFYLKDAYKEGNLIIIGIKTGSLIQEAGFVIPKGEKVVSKEDVKSFEASFIYPYFEGATYDL